jgi:PAS domain S-box-containing protein
MMWQETPYTIPLLAASTVSIILGLYIWWRFRRSWAMVGALLILASAEWTLGYALELGSGTLSAKILWNKLQFLGIVIIPVSWLIYMLHYTGHEKWVTRRSVTLLSIIPSITLLLVFTNEHHNLIWTSFFLDTEGPFPVLHQTHGMWSWFYVGYSYVLIICGFFPLVRMALQERRLYRWQTLLFLIGSSIPLVGNILQLAGLNPVPYLELTPLGFSATNVAIVLSILYLRLGDIVPVAREIIIEGMSDSVIVLDAKGCVIDVNHAAQQLIGNGDCIGQPIERIWPSWTNVRGSADYGSELSEEIVVGSRNNQRIFDVRVSPLIDWQDTLVGQIVVLRDITVRKQAEEQLLESEEKFRTIFENASDEIVYMDKDGTIIDISKKETLFGYDPEEIIGKNFTELDFVGLDMKKIDSFFRDIVIEGENMPVAMTEFEFSHKNGGRVFAEVSTRVIKKKGEVEAILGIVRDVTERKKAEEKIKSSLKEKEVLLREIHHRVKNNLQIVSSLLNLQSHYIKYKRCADMLKESQNRVRSMALIHEKLYQSENLSSINGDEYIETLVHELLRSYAANTDRITVTIDVEHISLGIDTAIPCGLIINELVSNSLKHAFPCGKGEIKVMLHSLNGDVELLVADNGIGLPEGIDFRSTETLGLRLVIILAEDQLNGEIELNSTEGTAFHIRFRGHPLQ